MTPYIIFYKAYVEDNNLRLLDTFDNTEGF